MGGGIKSRLGLSKDQFCLKLRKYRNFLGLLPEHLAIKILGYLNLKDLKSVALVCREWYKLTKSEKLWKAKCQKVIKGELISPKLLDLIFFNDRHLNRCRLLRHSN